MREYPVGLGSTPRRRKSGAGFIEARMRNLLTRHGLETFKVPADTAAAVQEQVRPILDYHVATFSAHGSVREQMARLAFDAYSQGLIHGNQIPRVPVPGDA